MSGWWGAVPGMASNTDPWWASMSQPGSPALKKVSNHALVSIRKRAKKIGLFTEAQLRVSARDSVDHFIKSTLAQFYFERGLVGLRVRKSLDPLAVDCGIAWFRRLSFSG